MKQEINYKQKTEKTTSMERLHITLLKNSGSMRKSKRKLKNTLRQMKMETHGSEFLGCSKSSFNKDIYNDTSLHYETRKTSSNLTFHIKELEKEETKFKDSKGKEILKIRAEINETESKKY